MRKHADAATTRRSGLTRCPTPAVRRAALGVAIDALERRTLMAAAPVITEFVASNANGLTDGNGVHADWIEIQNQGDTPIDLAGWHLTDNAAQPAKWTFPSLTLAAGAYTVVFASGNNTPDAAGNLHTNFSLSADGENLSLRRPDGTVVSQFGASGAVYPKQAADYSYGTTTVQNATTLVVSGAPARAYVPIDSTLDGNQWTAPGFVDTSWQGGTTGVGYDGGGTASAVDLLARWYAPSLGLANNAAVSAWNAVTGTGSATQATSGSRPTYRTNQINGRAVVHFDGVNDQLRITNQSLNGLADFSVAMVFRTSAAGRPGPQWYNNTGIVDAEVGGVTNDWGVAINDAGGIAAGVGNPDTTLTAGGGLANGQAHVVVFSKAGATTSLSVDGGAPVYGTASAAARTVGQLVFGSLNTNINYFNGDIGEVRLYDAALGDDAARALSSELGATWGVTAAPGVYQPQLGLDLQADMADRASTANIRVVFTVDTPSQFDRLTLNLKYDDGFVAYLNGTEVARRNAPGGAITYTSTATNTRPDSAALTAEAIDLSAFVGLLQGNGATNVLAIKALNVSAADSDLLVVPELVAASTTPAAAYMTTPTPRAANAPGYTGLVSPVTASVSHGYYATPFSTTLTTSTPGATLVYTLDGSTPTLSNGTKVLPPAGGATSATLNVSSTKVIRAAAFRNGYLPSTVSAESYLFVSDILQQAETTPAGAYWDVGLDGDVVNAQQTYSVAQALTAVPTVSLTIDNADMFGSAAGIYSNPLQKGVDWERKVSVEYFDPNNAANEFFINAGIRVNGGVSRETSRPKKSFKLYFRSEYGDSKLEYPLFGTDDPQTAFDHLVLRAGHNYSWANLGGTPYTRGDYLRDQFARMTQLALDGTGARGDFVQLYINGQYWGLYNAVGDLDSDFAAANYGGDADDYDIIQPDNAGGIEADEGTLDAWNDLFATADAAIANDGVIDTAEYAAISAKVDTRNLAHYMLGIFYRGDADAPVLIGSSTSPRNFVAMHNRAQPAAKFYFQTWDGELSLDNVNFDRTEVGGNQNPARLYQQLRTNPEFRQLFVDETASAFGSGGVLTTAENRARYAALVNDINVAIVGESARWGNAQQTAVAMRDTDWLNETNWITNIYMAHRSNVVLGQLQADFPALNLAAPAVFVNGVPSAGGAVAAGAAVTLADPNAPAGVIYYTLDGTDPRASGAVAATAVAYSGAFQLPGARTLQARVLKDGVWSPLRSVALTVTPPSLRLAEMMYHPAAPVTGSPYAKDEFEFLVLTNTGTTPVTLDGMQFTSGVTGTIPAGATLAAGASGVVVRNAAAFQFAYGTAAAILGVYTDKLSDAGERVTLYDPNSGTNVFDFTYTDAWYPTTDSGGYSLVVKDLAPSQAQASVLGTAAAWQASGTAGGSPGPFNTRPTAVTSVVVDDGSSQRSWVRTLTVEFNRGVSLTGIAAGAFAVQQLSGSVVAWTVAVDAVTPRAGGGTGVTLSFRQNGVARPLANGRYRLTIDGSKITDAFGVAVDAVGAGVRSSVRTYDFTRLLGDADGSLAVDFNDFLAMQTAFGSQAGDAAYRVGVDLDADGDVDFNDFLSLQTGFGSNV